MTYRRLLLVTAVTLSVFSKAFAQIASSDNPIELPLLHLYDIANQTQEDITTILGPQRSLRPADAAVAICPNCQKYAYQNDRIVIEYTNDMADRITIRPPAGTKVAATPSLLGLPPRQPDYKGDDQWKWLNYHDVREVSVLLDKDGRAKSILVKVITD